MGQFLGMKGIFYIQILDILITDVKNSALRY